ncbi:recombination regulator RecX [soil metagenome]
MARAGRLLAARPRAERELRDRLAGAGFEPEVVDWVIARLTELGLVDDTAFARQWIEERSRRGKAGRALVHELTARGVARETAQSALAAAGLDESAQAQAVAARHAVRVARLPLSQQAARIGAALLRRGYSSDVVAEAVRAVLPPDGWD